MYYPLQEVRFQDRAMSKKALYFCRIPTFLLAVLIRFAGLIFVLLPLYYVVDTTGFCLQDRFRHLSAEILMCPVTGLIGGAFLMVESADRNRLCSVEDLAVAACALTLAVAWALRDDHRHGRGWT